MNSKFKKVLASSLAGALVVGTVTHADFVHALQETQPQNTLTASEPEELQDENQPVVLSNQETGLQGKGTVEEPYLITSVEDLKFLQEKVNAGDKAYVSAVYKQTANIDLQGSKDNQWTPIGTTMNAFTGTYMGEGYEIKNLYIDNSELNNAGLFGYVADPGKIAGVKINGATVTGKSDVGALVGAAFTGTVTDCHVVGNINISGNYKVGGLIGSGYAAITNSSVKGENGSKVTGTYKAKDLEGDNVGGLIGFRGEGNIKTTSCSVSGLTVAGTRKVGGLIGSAYADNITSGCSVSDVSLICNAPYDYAKDVKNQLCVGGLLGIIHNSSNKGQLTDSSVSNINFSTADEKVRNENLPIFGLVSGGYRANDLSGASAPDGHITISNVTVSGNNSGSNAEVKFPGSVVMNGNQPLFTSGKGTEEDPYIISSLDELKVLVNAVNKTGLTFENQFIQLKAGLELDVTQEKWTSIGTLSHRFMGTFDGNGATVKGLNNSLFASVKNATIKNLKLLDVNMTNVKNKGALISGTIEGSLTVDGIEVTGSISGSDYVGGIIGGRASMQDGDVITIKNCINRATITGGNSAKIGGIIGYTNSKQGNWVVENCANYGDVISGYWAGGITGGTTRVTLTNCINEGNIKGKGTVGGLIGTANSGTTVELSSNSGNVSAEEGSAGGIIGSSSSGGNTVSKSSNIGNITGVLHAAGIIGGTGAQGDEIVNCYNGGDIVATGEGAIAAGIYGYNNSGKPVKACFNDGKIEASNGTVYQIGLSNFWYQPAPGSQIASCYFIEDGKIYAAAANGQNPSIEQKDMSRTELASVLNEAGGVADFWQSQNGTVQPDPLVPGVLEDENRLAIIKDASGNAIEGYTSLQAAANALKEGQTLVLEKDVVLDEKLVIKGVKDVTLDLNGKKLTLKEGVNTPLLDVVDSSLTLTNGSLSSNASTSMICVRSGASLTTRDVQIDFNDTNEKQANLAIQVQGKLFVENGTVLNSSEYGIGAVNDSVIEINGGQLTARYSAVSGNGTWKNTKITVNGGQLVSTEDVAIYHPQQGDLLLNGGTIKGLTGVQMCAGYLEVSSKSQVKVIATGDDLRKDKDGGDGAILDGAAISIVDRNYPGGKPTVVLTGGTYISEKTAESVLAYTWDAAATDQKYSPWQDVQKNVNITGGTYNKPFDVILLAKGFTLDKNADGTYGVHKHMMTKYEKKEPTCTETGLSQTYYQCEICKKYYEDAEGKVEIADVSSLVLQATGHKFEDGKCVVCGIAEEGYVPEKPKPTPNPDQDTDTDTNPNPNPDVNQDTNEGVQTGDTLMPAVYGGVALVSLGVLMALLKKRKVQ